MDLAEKNVLMPKFEELKDNINNKYKELIAMVEGLEQELIKELIINKNKLIDPNNRNIIHTNFEKDSLRINLYIKSPELNEYLDILAYICLMKGIGFISLKLDNYIRLEYTDSSDSYDMGLELKFDRYSARQQWEKEFQSNG